MEAATSTEKKDPSDIALDLNGRYGYQHVVVHTSLELGSGAYGKVVKATLDRLSCAAKILHQLILDQSRDPGLNKFIERFEQECQILRDLKHPGIVQFLGIVQDPNTNKPILLMELMKESLTHFLESSPTDIPYHVQVNISHDIALAVAHLHRNGIWHRDLSSNNILLDASRKAKVTDFGMSKIAASNPSMTRSKMTHCPGTLVYMPPEALSPQPRYSDKIDTFSIGVLLVQIVTRKFPTPTAASTTKEDPKSPTGESYVPVSEVERRRTDIDKIPSSHGFLPIVSSCLKDKSQDRPTTSQLCQSLGELKNSPAYEDSNKVPAKETRAVCIVGSVAPLPNESVVPQSPADLSDDDRQVLTELGLPPDKWDNLNARLALYNKTEYYDVFSVQVSKPGVELSRSYILEQIEFLLKNSTKKNGGAVVHYYGNGRRNTGDWCFRDGYITFRDIASLYMEHGHGRVLTLVPDCHSSGHWVSECAKFLDEQGVRPCGHSAKEKGILLKVYASCKTGQNAAELCYTTRAMKQKDGYVYHWCKKELSDQQNTFGYNFTEMRCKKEDECGISSEPTWPNVTASHRTYLVRGKDRGCPAWHYVLVDDDAENIKAFLQRTASGHVDVADYGTILRSGWGKDPPQETKDLMERKYNIIV